jgi:hypothetical protein
MSHTKRINPIAFELDKDGRPHFRDEIGKQLYAGKVKSGRYLRLTVRHLRYQHDGKCSEYAFSTDPETDKQYVGHLKRTSEKKLIVYLHFPKHLCHSASMNLHSRYFSTDDCLIECEDTEQYFYDWYEDSNCSGSGRCGLHDVYIPVKYEIVIM